MNAQGKLNESRCDRCTEPTAVGAGNINLVALGFPASQKGLLADAM